MRAHERGHSASAFPYAPTRHPLTADRPPPMAS